MFSYGPFHRDAPVLADQQELNLQQLCVDIGHSLGDLPETMDDREIHASSAIW